MLPILDITDAGGGINVAISSPPIAVNIIRVPVGELALFTSAGDCYQSCEPGEYLEIVVDRSGPDTVYPAVAKLVTIQPQ